MALELQYLPADVLGLPEWAARALAERPRPSTTPGVTLPSELAHFPEPEERLDADAREALATVLERELARHEPHVAVLESARALRTRGATLVLVGQQPGLLGGPLYNVHKALHAVALARALQRAWERPVLPAFWNHADDHDLAEVHHLWIQNKNLDLRKVSLAGLSSGRTPLAEVVFDEERHRLGALAELLRQDLWEGPEQAAALELFLPRAGESFASAFTRVLVRLFGHLGLLVIEPEWIRRPASNALARLVTTDVERALAAGAEAVRRTGREPTIEPREAALLFHHVDKKRNALRLSEGVFRYDGESGSRTPVELAAEIVQEPLDWSSGALLRPLVQDLVLPVAAYLGGWGELAYHAQLPALRRAAGAPATPFVPRFSATLLTEQERVALAKLGLTARDVLQRRGALSVADEPPPSSPAAVHLRAAARRAASELVALKDEVAAEDRGLAQHVKRTADQIEGLVEKLAEKLERVRQNSSGSERRHARRLSNGLYPNGEPQERVRGALEFVARQGTGWIDELLAGVEALPTEHVVVSLDGPG